MVLTLYKMDGSPAVRAVLMTIKALNIPDVEYVDLHLTRGDQMKEEYTKNNPQHTVPMLKDDDFYIWDSHAIATYLVTKYGKDDSLYPADPRKRAVIDQRLHFDSGILFPAARGCNEPLVFRGEKELRPENIEQLKKAYDLTEKFLTADWMAGDDVTLADICCVATVSSMNELLPIDKSKYPNISAWLERCSKQEFYKKNVPGLLEFYEQLRMGIKMFHATPASFKDRFEKTQ